MEDEKYKKEKRQLENLYDQLQKEEKNFDELEDEEWYFRQQENKKLEEMYENTDDPMIKKLIAEYDEKMYEERQKSNQLANDVRENLKEQYKEIETKINHIEEEQQNSRKEKS